MTHIKTWRERTNARGIGSCEAMDEEINELRAALAQQELPQKERPDFMAGYDAGMADAKRMAQQGEQRCAYCDGTGDVHGIDGEWRGSCPCAAAPAPQAQQGEPVAQARLGMQDGLAMALSVVELYGMKGDVIYREIAKLRDGIAAAPAPQAQDGRYIIAGSVWFRKSTNEWVLELSGSINDTSFVSRHTQPAETLPENVPSLSTLYAPAPQQDGTFIKEGTKSAPQPAQEPEKFLVNGTRFKLSFDTRGRVSSLWNFMDELDGRWVALVAAEDDCHLQSAQPEDGCAPNHMCNGHRVHIPTGECCNECGATSW